MIAANIQRFRVALVRCGFKPSLVKADYEYVDFREDSMPTRRVVLAAFGTRPTDFHSACVAVVDAPPGEADRTALLSKCWALGALFVFVVSDGSLEWWTMKARGPAKREDDLPLSRLESFFSEKADTFAPARILRQKSPFGRQLDFVDAGLIPALSFEVGEKLHVLIESLTLAGTRAYESAHGKAPDFPMLYRLLLRLLAAKILQDKGALAGLDFSSPSSVLREVARYYGPKAFTSPALDDPDVAQLVADRVAGSIRFHNLAADSLAYIYENTLVTKETRKRYGTHSTPRYIADYITWRLPIDELATDDRHVLDPGVGCATFLVSAMRRLRMDVDPHWSGNREHKYLAAHLHGFDVDGFALETAILSLTLADFPNRDGWDLTRDDLWTTSALEQRAQGSKILLANPPFENFTAEERSDLRSKRMEPRSANKAGEVLRRAIPHLPEGALIGMVLPREVLEGRRSEPLRESILRELHVLEICLLPEGMFTHSESESGVLLAKKHKQPALVRFRHVLARDRGRFKELYAATSEETVEQSCFDAFPFKVLRVPKLRDVWDCLAVRCEKLDTVADVGQGLSHKATEKPDAPPDVGQEVSHKPRKRLPPGTQLISETYFYGAARGYGNAEASLSCFALGPPVWMRIDEEAVLRSSRGTTIGVPRVLCNCGRSSAGQWRILAAVDRTGLAVAGSFFAVRPRSNDTPLEFLAAVINGPVANAYLYSLRDERNNSYPLVKRIPVPPASAAEVSDIVAAVRAYEDAIAPAGGSRAGLSVDDSRVRLARIDALVLNLYQLPKELRANLLRQFDGKERPRMPFAYTLSEDLLARGLQEKPPARGSGRVRGRPRGPPARRTRPRAGRRAGWASAARVRTRPPPAPRPLPCRASLTDAPPRPPG